MNTLYCQKLGECGGCSWGQRTLADQRREKLASVASLDSGVRFLDTPALGLRDRADLVWEDGRLGLYGLNARAIVDLPLCPMMSPALEAFYLEYRQRVPPIRKGSVRLRVSPTGERGVWLDFANADVKALFEEREYLLWLSSIAFVEIGQRNKALVWREGAPKLTDPILKPWFATYDDEMRPVPLFGPVGGFTQSGFTTNRALVQAVCDAAAGSAVKPWTELFCGNGNFALALAARGYDVEAVEFDELAVEGLKMSLAEHPEWNLPVTRLDVYMRTTNLPALTDRGLLVDPPRAGLRQVLQWLEAAPSHNRPAAILYVSCFTDVFLADSQRLKALGYRLDQLVGVDQFANSPHAEWVALFSRQN